MKASEIDLADICEEIRVSEEELEEGEKKYIENLHRAAMAYVRSYTGLSEEEIDSHEDISIAVLVLISDFYDMRQMSVGINNSYENKTVKSILDLYCTNLLPGA